MKPVSLLIFLLTTSGLWAQEYALSQLEQSPRHHEWVAVNYGDRTVHCFIAFPEVSDKVPVVLIIHENRGLNDWARSFADQIAAAGYVAIAPDLLSGAGPDGGRTRDFASSDAARQALYELDPGQVVSDLNAVSIYAKSLSAGNGKLAVVGFCWGGGQCFNLAIHNPHLSAACVFYGRAPGENSDFARITAPVYGFYGGNDARINAGIKDAAAYMKAAGKTFEPVIYEGAGHAYMRRGDDPAEAGPNKTARDQSWERLKRILGDL